MVKTQYIQGVMESETQLKTVLWQIHFHEFQRKEGLNSTMGKREEEW